MNLWANQKKLTMIKVAIIENDPLEKEKLVNLLNKSEYLECVMSASSVENFFKYFNKDTALDILLSGIGLPIVSGIAGIVKLKKINPDVQAIVLSSFYDVDTVFKVLRAGAKGYLLKGTPLSEIEQQLIDVKDGKLPLSPAIASSIINHFNQPPKEAIRDKLTPKETEVLRYLIEGDSYKSIASDLNISINSLRYHVKNIYKKLHVNARVQLIKMYFQGTLTEIQ